MVLEIDEQQQSCSMLTQVEEFCFITENTYTRQEIIDMESDILDKLRFECTTPTVKGFLRRFCRAAEDDVPDDRHGHHKMIRLRMKLPCRSLVPA